MATVTKIPTAAQPVAGTVAWLEEHIQRGASEPHAEVVTLTPGLASVLLSRNPDNRNITAAKLRHFAADMRRGVWPLNGETIIISKDGLLNDGQHRCAALIEANVTIPATIFFGADRETRKTVDLGSARTAAHFLAMDGISNTTHRASIARWVLAYEASDGQSLSAGNSFTNLECYERARRDEGVGRAAAYADAKSKHYRAFVQPSVLGFCHYAMHHIDEDAADEFVNQIVFGEGLKRKDPAYEVRQRLLDTPNKYEKAELILRGWAAFRQGRKLEHCKLLGSLPALV